MRILSFFMAVMLLITSFTAAMAQEEETMMYTDPKVLPQMEGMPELLRFLDGTEVKTPEDWQRRREEILGLYQYYIYGYLPDKAPLKYFLPWHAVQ